MYVDSVYHMYYTFNAAHIYTPSRPGKGIERKHRSLADGIVQFILVAFGASRISVHPSPGAGRMRMYVRVLREKCVYTYSQLSCTFG